MGFDPSIPLPQPRNPLQSSRAFCFPRGSYQRILRRANHYRTFGQTSIPILQRPRAPACIRSGRFSWASVDQQHWYRMAQCAWWWCLPSRLPFLHVGNGNRSVWKLCGKFVIFFSLAVSFTDDS